MLEKIKKRLPRLLLELALLLVFVVAVEAFLTRDAVSGKAPPFEGVTLSGKPFALATLQGRPAVVHFWATWCPVCNIEQGMIDSLAEDYPVITIAMQSGEAQEVLAYLQEHGVDYPVINDPQGSLARLYGVSGVPASFVLDGNGEVRFVTRGYTSGLGMRVRLWLAGII
jgi:thiol-disulfide isomerase/thioredoxin